MDNKEATVDEERCLSGLPEELVVCILNKVSDLKSLCRCSLISKLFASLIRRVTTITLTLPSTESSFARTNHHIRKSIREMKLPHPQLAEKFKLLESINLEYICPSNNGANNLLRWKVKWSKTWMTLVALLAASVYKKADPEPAPYAQERPIVRWWRDYCVWLSLSIFFEWWSTLCTTTKSHSSVKSVTITDSERRGILTARDEQLDGIRRNLVSNLFFETKTVEGIRKRGIMVPFLELPLSGYVMRDVFLSIIHSGEDVDQDDDEILAWDFDEEEKVFGEAVKEILNGPLRPEIFR